MASGHILDMQFPEATPIGAPGNDYQRIASSPASFGGLTAEAEQVAGRGLERAAETGLAALTEAQRLRNEIHANEKLTWFADQGTNLWEKFKGLEGKAAVDKLPEFKNNLQDLHGTVMDGESPQVQAMLSRGIANLQDRYYGWGAGHAGGQERQWHDKVATASASTFGSQAVLSAQHGTWDDVEVNLNKSDDEVRKLFERKQITGDALAAEVSKQRGRNVTAIVKTLIDQGDVSTANAVFNRYRDGMDASSLVAVNGALKTVNAQIEGRSIADETSGHRAPASREVAGVPAPFVAAVKQSEGFTPNAKWDVKQHSIGYGTKANSADERITRIEAEARFGAEFEKAAKFVDSVNPKLDPGSRAALASLTFNAGTAWAQSGLGDKVRAGDIEGAKLSFLQYNRAGGEVNEGLTARRYRESQWFGSDRPTTAVPLADKTEAYERVLARTDNNPLVQNAAIARLNQIYSISRQTEIGKSAEFDQRQGDTLAEARLTGTAKNPLSEAEFVERSGGNVEQAIINYREYIADLAASSDRHALATMPVTEQMAVLGKQTPIPGSAGYARQAQRHQETQMQMVAIDKVRREDPAASVADNAVIKAAQAQADLGKPETVRTLAALRLAAQEKLGIPERDRSPLTQAEALDLTTPLRRMLPGQERAVLTTMAKQFQQLYGPNADVAFTYALRANKLSAETSQAAANVMRKIGLGQTVTQDEASDADTENEHDAAALAVTATATPVGPAAASGGAMQRWIGQATPPERGTTSLRERQTAPSANASTAGRPTTAATGKPAPALPPTNDVMALRRNPALAKRFDEKYGGGSAKKVLDAYPLGVPQPAGAQ